MEDESSEQHQPEYKDFGWDPQSYVESLLRLENIDKRNRIDHVVDGITYSYFMSRLSYFHHKFDNADVEFSSNEYNQSNSLKNNGILFLPKAYTLTNLDPLTSFDNKFNYFSFMKNMFIILRNNVDKVEQIFGGIHEDVFFSTYFRIILTKPVEFGKKLEFIEELTTQSTLFIQSIFSTEINENNSILQYFNDEYNVVKATLIYSSEDRFFFNQHLHSILPTDDTELGDLGEEVLVCIVAIDLNDTFINFIPNSHYNKQKNENVTDLRLRKINLKNREAIIMNGQFVFSNSVYDGLNMSLQLIMVKKDLLHTESKMNAIATYLNYNKVFFPPEIVESSKKKNEVYCYEVDNNIDGKEDFNWSNILKEVVTDEISSNSSSATIQRLRECADSGNLAADDQGNEDAQNNLLDNRLHANRNAGNNNDKKRKRDINVNDLRSEFNSVTVIDDDQTVLVQYDESNLDYNDLKHEKSNINKKINIEILSNNNRIIEEENDYTTDEIISPESIFDNNEADTLLKYDESHQDDNKFNESLFEEPSLVLKEDLIAPKTMSNDDNDNNNNRNYYHNNVVGMLKNLFKF
jgi:hypothetical protein